MDYINNERESGITKKSYHISDVEQYTFALIEEFENYSKYPTKEEIDEFYESLRFDENYYEEDGFGGFRGKPTREQVAGCIGY